MLLRELTPQCSVESGALANADLADRATVALRQIRETGQLFSTGYVDATPRGTHD